MCEWHNDIMVNDIIDSEKALCLPAISDGKISECSKERSVAATLICPLWGRTSWIAVNQEVNH